jgi:hypothetical protein
VAKGSRALGADLVVPALAAAFALYFFVSTTDLVWEAKANGVVIGAALVALVVIQVARIALAVARGEGDLRTDVLWQPRDVLLKRAGMVAVTIVFILLLQVLGLTLFLSMAAALWLMGVRKAWVIFAISFGVAAAAYLLFILVLDAGFPHGAIENLFS